MDTTRLVDEVGFTPALHDRVRRGGVGGHSRVNEERRSDPLALAGTFLRVLREGLDAGLELPEAAARAAAALPRGAAERVGACGGWRASTARTNGASTRSSPGRSSRCSTSSTTTGGGCASSGVEHVPAHGRALLAANHAGILPWDATMMSVAILREHPLPRYPRFLVLNWAFDLPYVSMGMRRVGGVAASPQNALRLLEQDELVAVFPEGVKGTGKPFSERYRLQRFGRGGFVELALRAGAPIVPVAVVGSEEIYPKLGDSGTLARMMGAPFFPLTPTFPWLGPLGAIPLPSKWRIEFCEPIETASFGPGAATDRALVLELSERVRDTIQRRSSRTWSGAATPSSDRPRTRARGIGFSRHELQVERRVPVRHGPDLRDDEHRPRRWDRSCATRRPHSGSSSPTWTWS